MQKLGATEMESKYISSRGYIALSTVLIITAVSLSIAASISLLSIGDIRTSLSLSSGEITNVLTDGCMEDALLKIATSPTYTGSSISRPETTCTISVSKIGNTWTTNATTTDIDYKQTLQTISTRSASLKLFSWQEI